MFYRSASMAPDGETMHVYGGTHCFLPDLAHASMLFAPSLKDVWMFHIPTRTWTVLSEHTPLPDCSGAEALLAQPLLMAVLSLVVTASAFYT